MSRAYMRRAAGRERVQMLMKSLDWKVLRIVNKCGSVARLVTNTLPVASNVQNKHASRFQGAPAGRKLVTPSPTSLVDDPLMAAMQDVSTAAACPYCLKPFTTVGYWSEHVMRHSIPGQECPNTCHENQLYDNGTAL